MDNEIGLTDTELTSIETEIIKLKETFKPIKGTNIKRKLLPVLKTRSESVEETQWAFNLSWLNVSANISEDDSEFTLESWLTGVSIYHYEQKGLSHDFRPHIGQTVVRFSFTMVCSVGLMDKVGVNISVDAKVNNGIVNFEDDTMELEIED